MLPRLQFKGPHVTLFEDSLQGKKKKSHVKKQNLKQRNPKLFMPIFYLFYLKQRSPKSSNLSSISSSSSPKSQINPSKPHKSPLKAFLCISTSPTTTCFPFPRFCLLNRLQGLGWRSQCLSIGGIHYFWHADKLAIETNQVSRTKTISLGRRYVVFA